MKKQHLLIALIVLCLMLLGTARVRGAQGISIIRHVISGGGDQLEQGNYRLKPTIGQPIVGTYSDGTSALCIGFWCQRPDYRIYIPIVLKPASNDL